MRKEKKVDSHILFLHFAVDGFILCFAGLLLSITKHSLTLREETDTTGTSDFMK
jgi:hypothetical protein